MYFCSADGPAVLIIETHSCKRSTSFPQEADTMLELHPKEGQEGGLVTVIT